MVRRLKSAACLLGLLMFGIGCPENNAPPPPIATSGPVSRESTGGTKDGVDETGQSPPNTACDIWLQDCPPEHKCVPIDPAGSMRWTETACRPVAPSPVAPGAGCSMADGPEAGIDDCPADTFCYFTGPDGEAGQCIPFCDGTPDAPSCPDGMACGWGNGGAIALCRPTCDPLSQDCPGDHMTCLPTPPGTEFACYVMQWSQGSAGCTAHNGCRRGYACVPGEWLDEDAPHGLRRCSAFCDVGGNECLEGQVCRPWPDGTADGHPQVGVCALP